MAFRGDCAFPIAKGNRFRYTCFTLHGKEMADMTFDEARALLEENRQGHVLRFWDQLTDDQRAGLLKQVAELDFDSIGSMQGMLTDGGAGETAA